MKYLKYYENNDIDPFEEDNWDEEEIEPIKAKNGDIVPFENFVGMKFSNIIQNEEIIKFITSGGEEYSMYHQQDCCEYVRVEDVVGDWNDILNSPILLAREDTNEDDPPEDYYGSHMWTFYNIATIKGHVTIRWLGTSNGYYSESVSVRRTK